MENKSYNPAAAAARAYRLAYKQTPQGRAVVMWHDVNARCRNRNGRNPSYADISCDFTRESFMLWAIPAIAQFMQQQPGSVPSIDRIDPNSNYRLDNVRIVSWDMNTKGTRRKLAKQIYARRGNSPAYQTWLERAPISQVMVALNNQTGLQPGASLPYTRTSSGQPW